MILTQAENKALLILKDSPVQASKLSNKNNLYENTIPHSCGRSLEKKGLVACVNGWAILVPRLLWRTAWQVGDKVQFSGSNNYGTVKGSYINELEEEVFTVWSNILKKEVDCTRSNLVDHLALNEWTFKHAFKTMTGTLSHDQQTYTTKRINKNLLANAEYSKAFKQEILLLMDSDNKKFEKSSK
jgi:hypothetical protein